MKRPGLASENPFIPLVLKAFFCQTSVSKLDLESPGKVMKPEKTEFNVISQAPP